MPKLARTLGLVAAAATLTFGGSRPEAIGAPRHPGTPEVPVSEQLSLVQSLLPDVDVSQIDFVLPGDKGDAVHQRGSAGWICRGDRPGDSRFAISCYARALAPMLDRQRELIAEGTGGDAMRAQVDDEIRSGALRMPAPGLELSISGTLGADGSAPAELSVYYLLYVPFATSSTIGVSDVRPDDPTVPFLHHPGTHESHLMWMRAVTLTPSGGEGPAV